MNAFLGTGHLIRLILRRDRVRVSVWILGLTALVSGTASAIPGLYTTPAEIAGYARTADSPATRLLSGRPDDLDTVAAITSYEVSVAGLIALSLMMIFHVVRHTRTEEETGRAEVVRATVTGRHAGTAAAAITAALAAVLVGLIDTVVMLASGFEVSGSLLHGTMLASTGLVFAGVAAAAAQLTSASRGAVSIAAAVLAICFLVRGVGDVGGSFLSWLSPLGWALLAAPYGQARWWLVGPMIALTVGLMGLTTWLAAHRDAGAGVLHPSPGPARASTSLGTATGLAWRLQRGTIIGWAVGLTLAGVLFGSLGPELNDMLKDNPSLADFFDQSGGDPVTSFLVTVFGMLAAVTAGFAVSSALRLRSEETAGRAESLLATGLSRTRWAAGSLLVTGVASVALLALAGVGVAGSYAVAAQDAESFGRFTAAAVSLTPGVLLCAAIAVLLIGWLPRFSVAGLGLVVFAFVQIYLGNVLDLPAWVSGLSPFYHLPAMPVDDFGWGQTVVLLALATGAAALGLVGVRHRDLDSV